jgi:hypothetical protein
MKRSKGDGKFFEQSMMVAHGPTKRMKLSRAGSFSLEECSEIPLSSCKFVPFHADPLAHLLLYHFTILMRYLIVIIAIVALGSSLSLAA